MRRARASVSSLAVISAFIAGAIVAAPAFALSPAVETLPASSVIETTATVNGKVNPNGLETKYFFEYGTTTSYGSKSAEFSAGSGSSAVEKSQGLSGLTKKTEYHYRIVASNSSGTSHGADLTFRTVAPPEVLTAGAEPVESGEAATLVGAVLPNGLETTYQFEYGTESGSYTDKAPIPAKLAGSGFGVAEISTTVTGLTPGTTYFFRATATNARGKGDGGELSFWSSNAPGVGSLSSSHIRRGGAKISGVVEPHELNTKYYFEYGPTEAYGTKMEPKEISGETGSATVSAIVKDLSWETPYYYRLVAENSDGTVATGGAGFVTLAMSELTANGEPLESSPMKTLSGDLAINGRTCTEAEFTGESDENPGALQEVSAVTMQSGESGCEFFEYEMKYKRGINFAEPHAFEYGTNSAEETVVQTTSEFHVIGTLYAGGWKLNECEYNLDLSGVTESGKPLELTLTGEMEKIKGSVWCPGSEVVSGNFAITSEGKTVKANP